MIVDKKECKFCASSKIRNSNYKRAVKNDSYAIEGSELRN